METHENIKKLREKLGWSQEELAERVGYTDRSSIAKIEAGKVDLQQSKIAAFAAALSVSPAQLMGIDHTLPSNAYPLDSSEIVAYNVIGSIAAGYDSTAVEEYTGDVQAVPRSSLRGRPPEDFFVLRVKGNSMYPQFLEGDHVLVLRCSDVDNGAVAVVLYNGDEATLKKVWRGKGYLDLIPINPEYQPRRIEGADLSRCRILGRAATLLRDFH